MKTFIRIGAWYQAESAALESDLDISELISQQAPPPAPPTISCTCSKQVEELTERINNLDKKGENTFFVEREIPELKKVVKKTSKPQVKKVVVKKVVKKAAPKKK